MKDLNLNFSFPEERKEEERKTHVYDAFSLCFLGLKGCCIKLAGFPYFVRTKGKMLHVDTI